MPFIQHNPGRPCSGGSMGDGNEPIAIVGMAMRLPGGVYSEGDFWEMLINKKDGNCPVPASRYRAEGFFNPPTEPVSGHFLQEDPAYFDAQFFSIPANEAKRLDPQQRLLLEVVWECLENAGETNWRGANIGCYVGVFGDDWLELNLRNRQRDNLYQVLGTSAFALSNRLSYEFDLRGPSITIQTGCSAALVGLHEACQALKLHQCSGAIVAGTNLICTPTMTGFMAAGGILSPSGNSRTFDADADGYGRGEAVNAIYIKRLSDALRDGDPIRAVIRSTATNCDGKTVGLTHPSSEAQETLIRSAYRHAQLAGEWHKTALFECHGTGTVVGDSMETTGIANFFGQESVIIGSVKPNVGHSEGASGLTSLVKAVMALEHRTIPPNVHFQKSNPRISTTLTVPTEVMPWPEDRLERVSVNSFGVGGTNVHAILDSIAGFVPDHSQPNATERDSHLIVVSAKNADSLRKRIQDLTDFTNQHLNSLRDISYTLGVRREHLSHRAFAVAHPGMPLESSSFEATRSRPQQPVLSFVFTGQGAQWAGMGRELLKSDSNFITAIEGMEEALRQLDTPPQWFLKEELGRDPLSSRIDEVEIAQPLCTALQIGLCDVLAARGVVPGSVIGHSSGEIAAAYAAGAISAASAIIIAFYRGRLASSQAGLGAMASIGLGREAVAAYLMDGVVIACENSPHNVTLSGDRKTIDEILQRIKAEAPETFCRKLRVPIAYHSSNMARIGTQYEKAIAPHISHAIKMRPMFSTLTGELIKNPAHLDATYWRKNLESPVLFSGAVQALLEEQKADRAFLEVGPHSALAAPLREIYQVALPGKAQPVYIPTLIRNDDDCQSLLLTALGRLFTSGIPLDMSRAVEQGTVVTNLPRYPWQHDRRYWHESRACQQWRLRSIPHHELLGSRVPESTDLEPSWQNMLHPNNVLWLSDHVLNGRMTFPGAGYIAMAGEAVCQLHPESTEGYSIHNVQFRVPLILDEEEEIELLTNLRPIELADAVLSDCYQFTIAAYDGSAWTTHCQGQVRVGHEHSLQPRAIEAMSHPLLSARWYRALHKSGLELGPSFQGLEDITADPTSSAAVATVTNPPHLQTPDSRYTLHPTAIDQLLQMIGVAMTSGLLHQLPNRYVPAMVESLSIVRGAPRVQVAAKTWEGTRGQYGDAIGMAEGEVVLKMNGGFLVTVGPPPGSERPIPLVSRMEVKPDIDLLPPSQLLPSPASCDDIKHQAKVLKLLCVLCILAIENRIRDIASDSTNLMKWKACILKHATVIRERNDFYLAEVEEWIMGIQSEDPLIQVVQARLRQVVASIEENEHATNDRWLHCEALNPDVLEKVVPQLLNEVSPLVGDCSPIIDSLGLILEHCVGFMDGTRSPLDTLKSETEPLVKEVFDRGLGYVECDTFIDLFSHSKPGLRILEIGAGSGSTTSAVLKHLKSVNGDRMYSRYVFTDVSRELLGPAQDRFRKEENIEYETLDISKDPEDQGFEAHSFDLVIASYVIHSTPSLQTSLSNVLKLMSAKGRFLLHDFTKDMTYPDLIMGTLPDWWVGEDDGRPDGPCPSIDRWDHELRTAGFTDIETRVSETIGSIGIVSSSPSHALPMEEIVLVTTEDSHFPWKEELVEQFWKNGYVVHKTSLEQPPKEGQLVVLLLDTEKPYLDQMSETSFATIKKFLVESVGSQLLWVTQAVHLVCADPNFGSIHGLARALRKEMDLDISVLEIDKWNGTAAESVLRVCEKIHESRQLSDAELDFEFLLADGILQVARSHWSTFPQELSFTPEMEAPRMLSIGSLGRLDTIQWESQPPTPAALSAGVVEVNVEYVGLNFRDLLVLLGLVGTLNECGVEASGTVCQIGPSVTGLKPGDRVGIMGSGLFCTRTRIDQKLLRKLPDDLSLEDAAAMNVVYMTALYSLIEVGNLSKGQSVLIHCAAGGVGIASIRVCQMIGAEIYATVGSEEKASYLVEAFGISRNRIFHSRDNSFVPDLMQATNGRGVDIVLNSLAGKLLHASWECVAPYGKMIELGKRDFLTHGMLSMSPFLKNRSFIGVDLTGVINDRPDIATRLHQRFLDGWRQGFIKPIRPLQIFDAANVGDALRTLQTGSHMGKLIVRMPSDNPASLPCVSTQAVASFSPDCSYLLIGGLGGLGQAVSSWMVKHGASHLVYLSRSAGELEDHKAFIRQLELRGCQVTCVKGTVTSFSDVQQAVSQCPKPLAGVLQLAMNPIARTLFQITHEEWSSGIEPKIAGTWNLHHAVQGLDLDFFVMFGSASGIVGMGGQANYCASNSFLDYFARYRRQQGLAASTLNPGLVEEIGIVGQHPEFLERAHRTNALVLSETDLLNGVHLAIRDSRGEVDGSCSVCVGIGHAQSFSQSTSKATWGYDARFSPYQNLQGDMSSTRSQGSEDRLETILRQVETDPSCLNTAEITDAIKSALAKAVVEGVGGNQDLDEEQQKGLAIDSLMAIEIRTSFRRSLKIDIPSTEIIKAGTVGALGDLFIGYARLKYGLDEATPTTA